MWTHVGCMRVRTVTVVVGWLNFVSSILALVLVIFGFAYENAIIQALVKQYHDQGVDISADQITPYVTFALVLMLVLLLIGLLLASLLLMGTFKERHKLLLPWLIYMGISFAFSCLYALYNLFFKMIGTMPATFIIIWLILTALGLFIQYVILYAVYSFYKQLKYNGEQKRQEF